MVINNQFIVWSAKNPLQIDFTQFNKAEKGVANILNLLYLPTTLEIMVNKFK